MKKIISLSAVVLSMFLFVGCGGGGGSVDSDAKSILSGQTFYYTDDYLDDEDGFYADSFTDKTLTEVEYDADGEELYKESIDISYSGTNLILIDGDDKETCSVTRADKSVKIYCPSNGFTQILWDSISDAKANPQSDN